MNRKLLGLFWIVLTFALAGALAAGVPFFSRHFPMRFEKRLGTWAAVSESELCPLGPVKRAALDKLVKRLYPLAGDPDLEVNVELVRGSTVNAFATLGGRIYVYDGLLEQAQSPEELAGILAHEIEHIKQRHVIEGIFTRVVTAGLGALLVGNSATPDPRTLTLLMHMRYSRTEEADADRGGLERLKAAHVDPAGLEDFFERMDREHSVPEILSDHPSDTSRAEMVKEIHATSFEPVLSDDEWKLLRRSCKGA
jgi:predicted Zn-dependent protease